MASETQQMEIALLRWTCGFLSTAFVDMAAALARADQRTAEQMLFAINEAMAKSLFDERAKLIALGNSGAMLKPMAEMLHATLQDAKRAIEQAQRPH